MPHGGSLRVDASTKAAIGLADVVQKRKRSQAGAGYQVELSATGGESQTAIDGRLLQKRRDDGCDVGRMIHQTVPIHNLLGGIALELGPQRCGGWDIRERVRLHEWMVASYECRAIASFLSLCFGVQFWTPIGGQYSTPIDRLSYYEPVEMEHQLRVAGFGNIVQFGPEEATERYLRGRSDALQLPVYFRMIHAWL
jgi:hypothetical protein